MGTILITPASTNAYIQDTVIDNSYQSFWNALNEAVVTDLVLPVSENWGSENAVRTFAGIKSALEEQVSIGNYNYSTTVEGLNNICESFFLGNGDTSYVRIPFSGKGPAIDVSAVKNMLNGESIGFGPIGPDAVVDMADHALTQTIKSKVDAAIDLTIDGLNQFAVQDEQMQVIEDLRASLGNLKAATDQTLMSAALAIKNAIQADVEEARRGVNAASQSATIGIQE